MRARMFHRRRDGNLQSAVTCSLGAYLLPQPAGTTASPGADADAATLGFAELYVNALDKARSRGMGILDLSFFFSPSSSSSSSMTSTVCFASFFVLFFFLGLVPPGQYQLLSNASCSLCMSSSEPELSPARGFPFAVGRCSRVRSGCSTGT